MADFQIIGMDQFTKGMVKLYGVDTAAQQGALSGKNGIYGTRVGGVAAEILVFKGDLDTFAGFGVTPDWFEERIKSKKTVPCKQVFGSSGSRWAIDETALLLQVLNTEKGGTT